MSDDLTALMIDTVQEAGKVQGRLDVLLKVMDKFSDEKNQRWCKRQLLALRRKNCEVYSMLRVIE